MWERVAWGGFEKKVFFQVVKLCMEELSGRYTQKEILAFAGISRQAYHQYWQRRARDTDIKNQTLELAKEARSCWKYTRMGGRTMHAALHITQMGINRFEALLSENNLTVAMKRKWIRTTDGSAQSTDRNLVKGLEIRDINSVIVGDITYLFSGQDDLYYIFSLKDAFSKMIVGLHASKTMAAKDAQVCLKQAIRCRGAGNLANCIHHTDGGSQYRSRLYRGTGPFMAWSIAGNCLENGMSEQLNFILKNHYLECKEIKNVSQLNRFLAQVKRFINEECPIKSLGYQSPVQFEFNMEQIPLAERTPFTFSAFDGNGAGTFMEA